jgi:hypothetical protein
MRGTAGGLVSVCAAVCVLALAAGCGSSSTSSSTASTAPTSSTSTAATTTASGSAPGPVTPRNFTCQEVKASPAKAHALAALVVSDIKRVTSGGVIVSSEFANRQVLATCVHAAPDAKVYLGAVRAVGVSAPVIAALSNEH